MRGAVTAQEHKPQEAAAQEMRPKDPPRDSLPCVLYPDLPAFNIRLLDSFNVFNTYNIPKGAPALLVYFDPECSHCQLLAKALIAGMDSLSNINMFWITPIHSMTSLRKFYTDYHLADYKNIKVVGRDYEYFFNDFYGVHFVPDVALYDEKKKFVKLFENSVKVKDLYQLTHK